MPPASAAPSLVRRKGIRSSRRSGIVATCLSLCGASRDAVLIAIALMLAMTIFFIGVQMGSHLSSSPVVPVTLPTPTAPITKIIADTNHYIPIPAAVGDIFKDAQLQQLKQQQQQAEENILDDETRLEREEAQQKDDGGRDDDDVKSKKTMRIAREKDSIRVAMPHANQGYVRQFPQREVEKDDYSSGKVEARDRVHKESMQKSSQYDDVVDKNEESLGKAEAMTMLKGREENTRQFAQHIHLDEHGHFGDLDESVGIELNSNIRADLPNLMQDLFGWNGKTGVPFIFSAWVQLDPLKENETGRKHILSAGSNRNDCDNDGQMKSEVHTGNSGMIRFYVNHDHTADEELILDWSPGVGRRCYRVASYGFQVSMRKWNHVAFSIDPIEWVVKLYINGKIGAEEVTKKAALLSEDVIHQTPDKKLVSDTSDSDSVMFLGRGMEQMDETGELSMTLNGRIALVSVWSHNKTIDLILDNTNGEAGLMSQVHAIGYATESAKVSEQLKPLQPDYLYPLNEWDNIQKQIRLGKGINVVLQEIIYSRHGSLIIDKDRVESMASGTLIGKDKVQTKEQAGATAKDSSVSKEQTAITEKDSSIGFFPGVKRIVNAVRHVLHPNGRNYHPNIRAAGFRKELHPENPFKYFVPKGGRRYEEYIDGTTSVKITPAITEESNKIARERREYVKDAMIHAWSGYRKYAFGADELLPITKKPSDNWGGVGATLVDALDTLWLMGLRDEFWEARDWVRDKLSYENVGAVSVFETTIRSLGGLLSAYDLSGDPVFLEKADDLGTRLLHAFESPNGMPFSQTELKGHKSFHSPWQKNKAIIAETGTLQVEFRYLAQATKKQIYAEKVNKVFDILATNQPSSGLYPLYVRNDIPGITFSFEKASLGAMGDSLYEYMLKTWLQGGEIEEKYRTMFDRAMDGVDQHLVQKSHPDGLTYVADLVSKRLDHKMDHLACFMGGLWALGAYTNPDGLESPKAQRDLAHGKALTYTCYQMYARSPTGLSPEFVRFDRNSQGVDFSIGPAPAYLLRPEVVESLFILNYLTGDPIYREWGWEIFQAIERFCRTDNAFGQFKDVRKGNALPVDKMESFFLAETMKYLYLLFDPETPIDILNTHVFNTEAHPLRRFDRLEEVEFELEKVV